MTTWTLTAPMVGTRSAARAKSASSTRSKRDAARATLAYALLPAALLALFGVAIATIQLGASLHLDAVDPGEPTVVGPALATVHP